MGLPVEALKRETARSHLRVTFEKGGRVVGRVASSGGRVRWGPNLGIEFTYPAPGLQGPEELFSPGRRAARLWLREGMTGEIVAGGEGLPLECIGEWGLVRGRGDRRWVQLTPRMEGWVGYRGVRISFRYGPPPTRERMVRPQRVPWRFRRGLLAREEWPFALLTWGLYGVLVWLSLSLARLPLPPAPSPERVAERFARLIYEAPQAPTRARAEILKRAEQEAQPAPSEPAREPEAPAPPPESAPAPEPPRPAEAPKPEPAPPAAQAEAAPAPAPVPPKPGGGSRSREEIRQSVARKGLLGLLGGRGSAATSNTRGSILEGQGPAQDLDKVLERVEGLRAVPRRGQGGDLGAGESGPPAGIDEAARRVTAPTRTVRLEERRPERVEAPEEPALDELTLKEAVAAIHRTVGTYLGGIRYLYNRELRRNPDLEGKLTVSITIGPEGQVVSCEVVESTLESPVLEREVLARIRKWKFPPVARRDVTVTYPFVFFPSM